MQRWLNNIRFQGQVGQNLITQVRFGLITSYNPQNGLVIAQVQPVDSDNPDGSLTGWIPYATPWIGMQAAPRIGDQVIVIFQEGNVNCGIAIGVIYSDADSPPAAPSGEYWLVHPATGSTFKMKNDGTVEVTTNQALTLNANTVNATANSFNFTGDLNVTGNITATGNISDLNGGSGTIADMRSVYNTHTHPDPQGGDTGQPNQQMG